MELHVARALRMTRARLRQEMSTAEFTDWVAFLLLEVEAKRKAAEKKR
jgi:hypothetical protein